MCVHVLQEEATPYRTMIEVIVKFLTTTDSSRNTSATDTPTKTSHDTRIEGGVADNTSRKSERGHTVDARDTTLTVKSFIESGLSSEDKSMQSSKPSHGKPITYAPASTPLGSEFSSMSPDKRMPPPEPNYLWTDTGARKQSKSKHPAPSSLQDRSKVVTVRPRTRDRALQGSGVATSGPTMDIQASSSSRMQLTRGRSPRPELTCQPTHQSSWKPQGK